MAWAVVEVTGPPDRNVYINDKPTPSGRTNDFFPVPEGVNSFELKASRYGPAVYKEVEVTHQDPPVIIDLHSE